MSLRERQRGRTWHGLRGLMIQTRSGREINPFTESFSSESGTQKIFRIIMIKKLLIILCFEKSIWKKNYYRYRVQFSVQCCKIASRALVIEDGVRQKINVIYIYIYKMLYQLCPVSFILQILKAVDVSYQLYPLLLNSESCIRLMTHTNQDDDEGCLSLEDTSDTNYLISWENNSSDEMNPKRRVCKITNNFQKAGVMLWQSTVLRRLWHRITDATQQDANLWSAPKIERQDSSLQQKHKCETEEFWNCVYGPMRQTLTFI